MILYRQVAGSRYWLVEAVLSDSGDLVITSGDNDREWQAVVRRTNLPLLVAALPGSFPTAQASGVLDLLAAAFQRDDAAPNGPFEAIRRLLDEHRIPWEASTW